MARMGAQVAHVFLILAVLQGLAQAQFNLPVFVAEAVLNEQQHPDKTVMVTEKVTTTPAAVRPQHPKIVAGLKSEENAIEGTRSGGRVKREETFTRTRVDGVQRSSRRQSDIDSFLSELEGDIARTQHTKISAGSVNQAPSWSYKSPQTTQKPFWKRFGSTYDQVKTSVGSTYDQAKTKAKDIYKGFHL